MEGSSSMAATGQEGSNPPLPMKIDFSPLKSYFDRLDRKLKDPVLHTINDEITELVQCLMDKQEIVSDKCHLILRRFFDASIGKNVEVAAHTWEEVAALSLILRWFTSEEETIEKKLTELIGNLVSSEMVSDLDIGKIFLSGEAASDARIVQDSIVDKEVVNQELGHQIESGAHKEEMRTMPEVPENCCSKGKYVAEDGKSDHTLSDAVTMQELEDKFRGMADSERNYNKKLLGSAQSKMKEPRKEYYILNDNYEKFNRILGRANNLDKRMAPSLVDLFFLLKRYDQQITKIIQFSAALEWASEDDDPRFIKKIVDLLELADGELNGVKQWWKLEGVDNDDHSPERFLQEIKSVEQLLDELTMLSLDLEGYRRNRCLPEKQPLAAEDLALLEKNLEETEVELKRIEAKVDQLKTRVKEGRFTAVITALGHAADCIQSSKI